MTKKPETTAITATDELLMQDVTTHSGTLMAVLPGRIIDINPESNDQLHARLSALEAYIRDNARVLGWPEFKG